jgi:hypothetical protein
MNAPPTALTGVAMARAVASEWGWNEFGPFGSDVVMVGTSESYCPVVACGGDELWSRCR